MHQGQTSLVSDIIGWLCLSTATFTDGRRNSTSRTSRFCIHHNECLFQYSASHFLKQFTAVYLMQDQTAINRRRSLIISHLASLTYSPSLKRGTIRRIVRISSRACRLVTNVRKELASNHPRKRRTCRRIMAVFVCFIDRVTLLVHWLCLVNVQWKCWHLTFRDEEPILSLLLFTAPVQHWLISCSSTNSPT